MSVRWVRQALTALLVLAAGALLFADIFSGRAQQAAAPVAATPVAPKHFTVQALKPIARGSVIGRGEIELKQAPNAPAPGTYTSIAEAADRMATRNIAKSEALSDANTSVAVKGVGLSELIPPGL